MEFLRYLQSLLLNQFRSLKEVILELRLVVGLVATVALVFLITLRPVPPSKITIAAGLEGKPSHAIALSIADGLKKYGVSVDVKHSAGSIESADLLQDPRSDVDVALIVGGSVSQMDHNNLYTLGSVAYSPFWIFCRNNLPKLPSNISQIDSLGLKVGLGPEGGATYPLTAAIFDLNGIEIRNNKNYRKESYEKDVEDLLGGSLDCAIANATYFDAGVQKLLRNNKVFLMSTDNAIAYQMSTPYLTKVSIPIDAISIKDKIPKREIDLISSTLNLVVKKNLHPDIQNLLLSVTKEILLTTQYRFFAKVGQFPTYMDTSLQISPVAYHFYASGPPRVIPYLPYWVGGFISRVWLLILAITALIYPVSKVIQRLLEMRHKLRRFNLDC